MLAALRGGMLEGLFDGTNYVAVKRMLDATAMRHAAISNNIANLETPGYRRQDINPEFQRELNRLMEAGDTAGMRTLEPTIEVDPRATSNGPTGNTISLDSELLELNRNSLQYEILAQFSSGSLRHLRMAITGRHR